MPRLTKQLLDGATANALDGEVFLWDADVKGFGVRIKPTGVKSYVLKYRIATRTRRYTISKVGSPYTVEEARHIAADMLRGIHAGQDPMQVKATARQALTLGELADLYLAEGPAEKPNKKASSWVTDSSNINRHIRPLLGRKLVKSLTQADIARFQADVASGKTAADLKTKRQGRAIVRGGKSTAARSLAVLGATLQFAVARGILTANPAKGVKLLRSERKERFLSEIEIARLSDILAKMEVEGLNKNAASAIRLLLLTGCRKNEILSARWEYVDFEQQCLRLPDSKTGAKVVPLAAAALALFAALPRPDCDGWIFSARRPPKGMGRLKTDIAPGYYTGLQKAWENIRDRAGLPGLRLHDLRHSFASFAVADGATLFMVGKVLGHKQTRTTEIYAHLAADPVRAVADRAANRITNAMRGKKTAGAAVVALPARGN